MTKDQLIKWEKLLFQLEIILECTHDLSTLTENQLNYFESQTQLILPEEYKNYCQIIGSGRFSRSQFSIDCPDVNSIQETLTSNEIILEAYTSRHSWSLTILQLLDSAYLFGGGLDFKELLIFDLRTYREIDQSYDIYFVSPDGDVNFLSRSFFDLIKDYCIGDQFIDIYIDNQYKKQSIEQQLKDAEELAGSNFSEMDEPHPLQYQEKIFVPFTMEEDNDFF